MFCAASSPYVRGKVKASLRPLPAKSKLPNATKHFDDFNKTMFGMVAEREAVINTLNTKILKMSGVMKATEEYLESTKKIIREKETTEKELADLLPTLQDKFQQVEAESAKLRQDILKLRSSNVALKLHNRALEQRIAELEASASQATTP